MPKQPRSKALRREALEKGPPGGAITCFATAVGLLAYGHVMAGAILLVIAWLLGTWALFSARSIRDTWRWGPHTLSLVLVVVLSGLGYWLERRSARPPSVTAAPFAGAQINQDSRGAVNSPNVVGDLTINPEVNPYAPVVTYDFNGVKHVSKSGGSYLESTRAEAFEAFEKMQSLRNAHSWRPLARLCETEIRCAPEWLTPYLYAGEAYVNLGDRKKAIERLEYVEKHASGNPDYADATRLLEQLRRTGK